MVYCYNLSFGRTKLMLKIKNKYNFTIRISKEADSVMLVTEQQFTNYTKKK